MAERDRAAVDVELRTIKMQLAVASQDLGCEGLIEFDQVEIRHSQLTFFFQLTQRRHWADSHDSRIHAHGTYSENTSQWFEIIFPGEVFAREHNRGSAIRDAGRIARCDRAGLGEHGRKLGHLFHRGSQKNMFVAAESLRTFLALKSNRRKFVVESLAVNGCRCAALRAECKFVLLFARDLVLLG